MNGQMTAKKLRTILFIIMLLVIVAVAGGFLYARHSLTGYATAISQLNADAASGDQNIATLKNLEKRMDAEASTVDTAKATIADSSTFAETVVSDVARIAAQSGVTISSLEYVDAGSASSGATAAPTATASPTTPATPGAAAPAGVNKKSISVTVESPIKYSTLMTFIRNIEANNLKLQIASVSLTNEGGGNVGTQTFSIGAYVR